MHTSPKLLSKVRLISCCHKLWR